MLYLHRVATENDSNGHPSNHAQVGPVSGQQMTDIKASTSYHCQTSLKMFAIMP